MLNKSIEALVGLVDMKVEGCFQAMLKMGWEEYENMGDASKYIRDIISILENHIKIVKDLLTETYLIFYLNKLVVHLNNKFILSIFKLRKISEV